MILVVVYAGSNWIYIKYLQKNDVFLCVCVHVCASVLIPWLKVDDLANQ